MSQPFMPHPSSMLLGRRTFLGTSATAASTAALASLLGRDALAAPSAPAFPLPKGAVLPALHFAPRAKRVIYLFQSGGPSQIELLDPKPGLVARHGSELPDSIRNGQRLTGMTSGQKSFPVIASKYGFKPCGESGTLIS